MALFNRCSWLYNESMLIEGVFAAVPTPFYSDERVYYRKLEANMAHYSRSLLAGMLLLGSTGEAVMLDDAESREVLRVAAEAASPEKVLIAGVGKQSVKGTLGLAEAAARFNYDAVLVRTPTYYAGRMSSAAVLNYFRSVADRSPLPVLLYNIPVCVPYDIPVEIVAELAQHPNIIGIKDSSGSIERIRSIIASTQTVARRKATVTPIFEAVTARMLAPKADGNGIFVSSGDLKSGAAARKRAASNTPQDKNQRSWLSGAHRLRRNPARFAPGRRRAEPSGFCLLRPSSLPGGLSGLEGSRPETRRREAAAHHRSGPPHRWTIRH